MATGTIFIPAYNCEQFLPELFQSLASQTNQEFDILFVDDASTDGTLWVANQLLKELFPRRHRVIKNEFNTGKAASAYNNLRDVETDYIAIIDGDDCLIDKEILNIFSFNYDNNFDVVYSNYITSDGRRGHSAALDPFICPRMQGWRTSHFFSFRANLFKDIPIGYLKNKRGEWFRCACDLAIAFPILDQTRRYKYIDRQAYRYTSTRPESHHNSNGITRSLSSPKQRENGAIIIGYPALACKNALEGSGPPYDAFLLARLSKIEQSLRALDTAEQLNDLELSRLSLAQLAVQEHIPLSWLQQTGGWAIEHQVYSYITERLAGIQNPSILEFGSGVGSKILHKIARNRGGYCVSVEHDKKWYERTSGELAKNNLYFEKSVIFANLVGMSIFGVDVEFYDMEWLAEDMKFDLVVVDGPPTAIAPFGRLASFSSIAKNLTANFSLILDDFNRDAERGIVEAWRRVAPELNYEEIKFSKKSVCVVSPG